MNETTGIFVNKTTYDQRALTAMNRLAELSVRKEKAIRNRGLAFLMGAIGLVAGAYVYPKQSMVGSLLLLYGVLLLLVAISWKSFQLRSSQRQLRQGVRECTYDFREDELVCITAAETNHYPYDQMYAVVSDKDWYVLFLDEGHGVILDKNGFIEGEPMMFKSFIGQHTQLPIQEL